MNAISCGYRIYPAWFGGDSMAAPMKETADGAAAQMGRRVGGIVITGRGTDGRGDFIDFRVSYSSTSGMVVEMKR